MRAIWLRAGSRTRAPRVAVIVLTLAALLLVLVGMHSTMVESTSCSGAPMTASAAHPHAGSPFSETTVRSTPAGPTDMGMLDCLLMDLLCVLVAVGLVAAAVLLALARSLLRPHVAARSLRSLLVHLRPPEPPSLQLLSISRT